MSRKTSQLQAQKEIAEADLSKAYEEIRKLQNSLYEIERSEKEKANQNSFIEGAKLR